MSCAPAVSLFDSSGSLGELSNYATSPFFLDGQSWQTLEHFFQASKFCSNSVRDVIRQSGTPEYAKVLAWGRFRREIRNDWETVRVGVMLRGLRAKCSQSEEFRTALWDSWPWPIFEDSEIDEFWGIGRDGHGQNLLGSCLEEIRAEIIGHNSVYQPRLISRPTHSCQSMYRLMELENIIPNLGVVAYPRAELSSQLLFSVSVDAVMDAELALLGISTGQGISTSGASGFPNLCQWLQQQNSHVSAEGIRSLLRNTRALAFTYKYKRYSWSDDVRSAITNWCGRFWKAFGKIFDATDPFPVIVVGGGVGEEAKYIWRDLGSRVTFVDVSDELVDLATSQVSGSQGLTAGAESLARCDPAQFSVYISLRAFQSYLFDVSSALEEARRVLVPGGYIVISISDAYLNESGVPIRGRIISSGDLSMGESARDTISLLQSMREAGFSSMEVQSFGSEIFVVARAP